MTAPAPPKTVVRKKRRAAARPTAHVAYQPAGFDLAGRRVKERYHAITDQAVKVGFLTRHPGDPLCGATGPWADIPDGLFPPLVTCPNCQHITAGQHITITGTMP